MAYTRESDKTNSLYIVSIPHELHKVLNFIQSLKLREDKSINSSSTYIMVIRANQT